MPRTQHGAGRRRSASTAPGRARPEGPTDAFFGALSERGHDPVLRRTNGTLRFDLRDGDRLQHWHVTVTRGDVSLHRARRQADVVVRTDKSMFDALVTGRLNGMAALLRGDAEAEGDLGLLLLFQRIFPGPAQPGDGTAETDSTPA